jgi:hypothetical protein
VCDSGSAGDDAVAVVELDPVVVVDVEHVAVPVFSQSIEPRRKSVCMCRLSWYSEWIDHFECGV